jgi:hypothetical protein
LALAFQLRSSAKLTSARTTAEAVAVLPLRMPPTSRAATVALTGSEIVSRSPEPDSEIAPRVTSPTMSAIDVGRDLDVAPERPDPLPADAFLVGLVDRPQLVRRLALERGLEVVEREIDRHHQRRVARLEMRRAGRSRRRVGIAAAAATTKHERHDKADRRR